VAEVPIADQLRWLRQVLAYRGVVVRRSMYVRNRQVLAYRRRGGGAAIDVRVQSVFSPAAMAPVLRSEKTMPRQLSS
jgi:hypothetical protein